MRLAHSIPLDLKILKEPYEKELRWQLGNPERESASLVQAIDDSLGVWRRNKVIENTRTGMRITSSASSIMEALKIRALSVDQPCSRARVAICRLMIRTRRIEAISPTTRKGSMARKMGERIEMRTVCKISTSMRTTSNWSSTLSVSAAIVHWTNT